MTSSGSRGVRYCEKCEIKVGPQPVVCPRCMGPLVTYVPARVFDAVRNDARARETRSPLVLGAAAVVLALGGVTFGLARGASTPAPVEPVVLGRPTVQAAGARETTRSPREQGDPVAAAEDADVAGDRSFNAGDLEQALAKYREVLEKHPGNLEALNNAGQALVRLERPAEAVPLLERAVGASPGSWMAQFNLARALGATGEWARAAEHYRAAATVMPGHYPTLFNLGRALQKAGQDEAAIAEYRNAAAADARQPDAWLALGAACERASRTADARAAFERYLELVPDSPQRATIEQRLAATGKS